MTFGGEPLHPSRPVRPRTAAEERRRLLQEVCGTDFAKADRVLTLPLFRVAMEGKRAVRKPK